MVHLERGYETNLLKLERTSPTADSQGTTHLERCCTVSVGLCWEGDVWSTDTEGRRVLGVSSLNHGLRNHINPLLLALRVRQQARVCGPRAP